MSQSFDPRLTWTLIKPMTDDAYKNVFSARNGMANAVSGLAANVNSGIDALMARYDRIDAANKAANTQSLLNQMNQINSLEELEQARASGLLDLNQQREIYGDTGGINESLFNKTVGMLPQHQYERAALLDEAKMFTPAARQDLITLTKGLGRNNPEQAAKGVTNNLPASMILGSGAPLSQASKNAFDMNMSKNRYNLAVQQSQADKQRWETAESNIEKLAASLEKQAKMQQQIYTAQIHGSSLEQAANNVSLAMNQLSVHGLLPADVHRLLSSDPKKLSPIDADLRNTVIDWYKNNRDYLVQGTAYLKMYGWKDDFIPTTDKLIGISGSETQGNSAAVPFGQTQATAPQNNASTPSSNLDGVVQADQNHLDVLDVIRTGKITDKTSQAAKNWYAKNRAVIPRMQHNIKLAEDLIVDEYKKNALGSSDVSVRLGAYNITPDVLMGTVSFSDLKPNTGDAAKDKVLKAEFATMQNRYPQIKSNLIRAGNSRNKTEFRRIFRELLTEEDSSNWQTVKGLANMSVAENIADALYTAYTNSNNNGDTIDYTANIMNYFRGVSKDFSVIDEEDSIVGAVQALSGIEKGLKTKYASGLSETQNKAKMQNNSHMLAPLLNATTYFNSKEEVAAYLNNNGIVSFAADANMNRQKKSKESEALNSDFIKALSMVKAIRENLKVGLAYPRGNIASLTSAERDSIRFAKETLSKLEKERYKDEANQLRKALGTL